MIKNCHPIPLIPELINQLHRAKYFTKLDVCWGYNNVCICKGDEWKAAFWTNQGLFEPLVMFFSLTNSPATFQTMMNNIFRDLIMEGAVCVELPESNGYDAVMNVVDSISKRTHFVPTNMTINALRAARLYLMHVWKHHGLLRQVVSD